MTVNIPAEPCASLFHPHTAVLDQSSPATSASCLYRTSGSTLPQTVQSVSIRKGTHTRTRLACGEVQLHVNMFVPAPSETCVCVVSVHSPNSACISPPVPVRMGQH